MVYIFTILYFDSSAFYYDSSVGGGGIYKHIYVYKCDIDMCDIDINVICIIMLIHLPTRCE